MARWTLRAVILGAAIGLLLMLGTSADPIERSASTSGNEPVVVAAAEPVLRPMLVARAGAGGAGPAPAEASPPRHGALRGTVVGPDGEPVAGARVVLLPTEVEGVDVAALEDGAYTVVQSDATGTFSVPRRALGSARLVAFAPGLVPASLDPSQAHAATSELVIRLGAPWSASVRVTGPDGSWPDGCEVYCETRPPGVWGLAGRPEQLHADARIAAPREGVQATVSLATRAPVRFEVWAPHGLASIPRTLTLEHPAQRASFRLVPSARVRVHLQTPPGRPDLSEQATIGVCVRALEDHRSVVSFTQRSQHVSVESGLSPGRYVLQVRVTGYAPVDRVIEVAEPGQRIEPNIELRARSPGEEPGRVVLRVGTNPVPKVRYRTTGQKTWRDARPRVLADGRIELAPSRFELQEAGLLPGVYDLLVEGTAFEAVLVPGVRVFGGQENEFTVSPSR